MCLGSLLSYCTCGNGTKIIGIVLVICSYVLPVRSFIRTDIDIENIMFLAGIILIIGIDAFLNSLKGTAVFIGGVLLAYFYMYVYALYLSGLIIAVIGLYMIVRVKYGTITWLFEKMTGLDVPSFMK